MAARSFATAPATLEGADSTRMSMSIANESTVAGQNVFVRYKSEGTPDPTSTDHDYIIGPGNEKSWTYIEDGEDMRHSFRIATNATITVSWNSSRDQK